MKRIWIPLIVAAMTSVASAQSYGRYQTCTLQTAQGNAVSNAEVYFLTQPANTTALTPLAAVFTSATGGSTLNPVRTNGFGECSAYLAPGVYTVVYVSSATGKLIYPDQNIAIGGGTASAPTFAQILTGVNNQAAMVLGTGSSLSTSGSGTNAATSVGGITVSGTPGVGQVLTATSSSAANWQTGGGGGGSGFPITLGTTVINPFSTTSSISGLTLNNPTFITPNLGTPSAGILTNATGLPLSSGVTGVLAPGNGGDGIANTSTERRGTANRDWTPFSGLVFNTITTGAIRAGISADVIALWTGTCNSSTVLSGAGTCITGGGGGGISGLTPGYIPQATTASTITTDSHMNDGVTTASVITSSERITAPSYTTNGTVPGNLGLAAGTGSIAALAANSAGFAAPTTGGTAYLYKLPATAVVGILHAAAPATADGVNESALTSSAVSLTADVTGVLPIANGGSPAIANSTITIGTTTINANTCNTVATLTMTGLATTSTVNFTPTTDVSAVTGWGASGGLTIVDWVTSNTLHYYACNQSASNITPGGSVTFNVSAR